MFSGPRDLDASGALLAISSKVMLRTSLSELQNDDGRTLSVLVAYWRMRWEIRDDGYKSHLRKKGSVILPDKEASFRRLQIVKIHINNHGAEWAAMRVQRSHRCVTRQWFGVDSLRMPRAN